MDRTKAHHCLAVANHESKEGASGPDQYEQADATLCADINGYQRRFFPLLPRGEQSKASARLVSLPGLLSYSLVA